MQSFAQNLVFFRQPFVIRGKTGDLICSLFQFTGLGLIKSLVVSGVGISGTGSWRCRLSVFLSPTALTGRGNQFMGNRILNAEVFSFGT